MAFDELLKRFGRTQDYMQRVAHPLTGCTMPSEEEFFLIQPTDSRELSVDEFARSIGIRNRTALLQMINAIGQDFWADYKLGLLAVGTKTFTAKFWNGVEDDARKGAAQDFTSILKRGGEDIDLVLVSNSIEAQANLKRPRVSKTSRPMWIDHFTDKLTAIGASCEVKYTFENGAFYFPFTLEGGPREAFILDERAWRHKYRARGRSIIISLEGTAPIHIRQNFAATADEILRVERMNRYCFSELFLDGNSGPFLKLLEAENRQGDLFGDDF